MPPSAVDPHTDRHADPDAELLRALRAGQEQAFVALVERYGALMLRDALTHVPSRAVADVVQETWMAVLAGLDHVEGRSSLKTWMFRILSNRAKTHGERERRCLPFSSLAPDDEESGAAVDADRPRRRPSGLARAAG